MRGRSEDAEESGLGGDDDRVARCERGREDEDDAGEGGVKEVETADDERGRRQLRRRRGSRSIKAGHIGGGKLQRREWSGVRIMRAVKRVMTTL